MIDLGPLRNVGLLELDEVADLGAVGEARAWPDPGERSDDSLRSDHSTFDMAERVDRRPVGNLDIRTEDDMRLDRNIAAEPGVKSKPHAFGIDQRRPLLNRLLAPPALPFKFEVGSSARLLTPAASYGSPSITTASRPSAAAMFTISGR